VKPEITVYVRGIKVPVGEALVEELYQIKRASPYHDTWFKVKLKKLYTYVLLDDQRSLVDIVTELSEQHGLELKIIDVSKKTAIYRFWKKLNGIKTFPAVETNRGGRLQAPFSQSDLEKLISESAQPTH